MPLIGDEETRHNNDNLMLSSNLELTITQMVMNDMNEALLMTSTCLEDIWLLINRVGHVLVWLPGSQPAWRYPQTCRGALWCCSPASWCLYDGPRSHSGPAGWSLTPWSSENEKRHRREVRQHSPDTVHSTSISSDGSAVGASPQRETSLYNHNAAEKHSLNCEADVFPQRFTET